MQYFNIQVASQLSGVASATIRAWEKRYNAVVPERAENKHRLYSEKDIEKLALLFRLTEFGQSIGKIAHLDLDHLKQIYTTLMHRPYDERQVITPNHDKIDHDKVLNSVQLALSLYKLDIISHELDKAMALLPAREFCLQLIVPLLEEASIKVARHELNAAQEQALKTIVDFHLGKAICQHYQKGHARDELVLAVGSPLAALLCSHYELRVVHLGPDITAAQTGEAAMSLKCRAIVIDPGSRSTDYAHELKQMAAGSEVWYLPTLHALDGHLAAKWGRPSETELLH